jgi:hypothetical protein
MIAPYHLPTPDEMELAAIFREIDRGRKPIEEDAELTEAIRQEIRKYRAGKRRRK